MDLSMRYAHCDGHTEVTYSDDGKYLITCGADGDIRIFDGFEDDDPKTHHMGDTVKALHFKNGLVYVPTDSNAVVAYNFPEMTCDGVLLQFFTAVYHITSNNSSRLIAAGGGDFTIKVYDNVAKNFATCRGHDAPILSLDFDPDDQYLASSSCDGTVRIWQLSDYSCIKILNVLKASNDFGNSETLCRLQWYPKKGKFLAVPVQHEIRLYEKESWLCHITLCCDDIHDIKVLSVVAFSPCGQYIAAGSTSGTLLVWDLKTRKVVGMKGHSKSVSLCSLAWQPSGKKEVVFCDVEGQLGFYDEIAFDTCKDQKALPQEAVGEDHEPLKFPPALDEDEDDIAFDIGAIKAKYETSLLELEDEMDVVPSATTECVKDKEKPVEIATSQQTSFQPSSTPVHLDHRFMVWNSVGIVRSYNTDEENSIDVEFHDTSICHPIHINNIHCFTMASLSAEALILASSKMDDSYSKLHCLHFTTWDSHKEWTVDMLDDEDIEAVTLGTHWVAAATDKRLIRLFTVSGIQCEAFCVSGPVICLAGFENQLAVAYHQGAGIPGEQNLGLLLANVSHKMHCSCKKHDLPITSKSFVTWMGFTDEGQVCTVDTSGIVRILNTHRGSKWTQVGNTKSHVKGKSDNYFVVGLSEMQQEIRGIPCKGSHYPSILPRPTVTTIPFTFPFCGMTTDKGKLEEENMRISALHSRIRYLLTNNPNLDSKLSNVEKNWTVVLLKMFALATRSDREFQALDIAELMPNSSMVQGAIKYATQRNHMGLAQRLGDVMHKKIMEESSSATNAEEEEEDKCFFQTSTNSANFIGDSLNSDCKIRPKTLIRRRPESFKKANHQEDQEEPREQCSELDETIPLLPSTDAVINPFKIAKPNDISSVRDNSGLDGMLFENTDLHSNTEQVAVINETKAVKQCSLWELKCDNSLAPKKFGFALFLEQKRKQLALDNPSMEENEIIKLATKMFKELPPKEKEKYKSKPKEICPSPEAIASGKRKVDTKACSTRDGGLSETKKCKKDTESSISSSTKNLLSMFAFAKNKTS